MRETTLKLRAPPGHFRVIGVDTFDREDTGHVIGDYPERDVALTKARTSGGTMYKTHVYDDMGRHIGEGGTF